MHWLSDLVCHVRDPQTNNQKLARGASHNGPPANDANVGRKTVPWATWLAYLIFRT